MKNRYLYAFLICLALCIASARALSDSDYQIRSLENFDMMMRSSLLIGLDSTDYNFVALEPTGTPPDYSSLYYWDFYTCNGDDDTGFTVTHAAAQNAFPVTITTWVKPDRTQIDSYGVIVSKTWKYILYVINDGRIALAYMDAGLNWRSLVTTTTITDLAWTHVAASLTSNSTNTDMKIYINGALDSSSTETGQPQDYLGVLQVGANVTAPTDRLKGALYKTEIYASLLTASEIYTLSQQFNAISGINCYLWVAGEYGGHLFFNNEENVTAIIHESIDAVRVNGAFYAEGDYINFLAGSGYDIEWSYTLAPLINLDLGLGIFGLLLCFICPIGIIKALRERDVDRATLIYFIGLCLGIAFLWGWLFA